MVCYGIGLFFRPGHGYLLSILGLSGPLSLVSYFVRSQASFLLNLSSWEPSQTYERSASSQLGRKKKKKKKPRQRGRGTEAKERVTLFSH